MISRYARQVVLPEVGSLGQEFLAKARMLIVGAGGLGSPAMLYLTAAGVGLRSHGGRIGIIDDDTVDLSNLQRQIIYRESDQGDSKTLAAATHLMSLNSETEVVTHTERLNAENILAIIEEYDLIIDGSDNFPTKYLVNDAAIKSGKPVVYGSILGFEGQVSVFWATHGPCYRCIYPEQAQSHIPNCAEAGTLGAIAGVIGSIQAIEACKLALGTEHCKKFGLEPLIGQILILDALSWDIRKLAITKSDDCPSCSVNPTSISLLDNDPIICGNEARKPITLADFQDILDSGIPITLVDVRETHEWESGHLDGAIHIPLASLLSNDEVVKQIDPSCLVVIYCQHGIRSTRAVSHLSSNGFEAINLLVDWPN